MDGDPHGPPAVEDSDTPLGDGVQRHELLAFERVSARLIGRRQKRVSIGRYRMREELGRGGFGAVYVAHDPELERDVAIKLVLPRKGREGPKWEARLVREAQTLAQLEHPNVVTVYDVGVDTDSGGVYIVMELLRGRSVRAWLKHEDRPAWQHVVDAFLGAARGLAAAHAVDVVHRDFKPENVMLTPSGVATVIDFGLARDVGELDSTRISSVSGEIRAMPDGRALTSVGTVMGTPPYMAPEQHTLGKVGPAADQYALCVSLFEALYGIRPFVAPDVEALYEVKCSMSFEPLPKGHGVPRAVHAVLLRGLNPVVDRRWPSVKAFAQALESAARPRRRVLAWTGGAAAAVALAVLGAVQLQPAEDRCRALESDAAEVWSGARAAGLQERVLGDASVAEATTWASAQGRLESKMESWGGALARSCTTSATPNLDCLEQWLRDAESVVQVLESDSTPLLSMVSVVDALPPVQACEIGGGTAVARPDLRRDLVRARALLRAGSGEEALALADAVMSQATASEDGPLLAQAGLAAGLIYAERERLDDARRVLVDAVGHADAVGLDAVAAEASIVLVRVSGAMGRFDDAHRWNALAQARIARVGSPLYLQNLLLGARAFSLIYEGDYAGAYALSQTLVAQLPEDKTFERARAMANVAITAFEIGRMHEARVVSGDARALMASVLGKQHAAVGRIMADEGRYAAAAGEIEDGVAMMQQAVEILEAAGGPNDPYALNTKRTLAHYLSRLGQDEASLTMLEQTYASTVALYGEAHVRTATTAFALADQYLMAERAKDAVPLVRGALASLTELYGAGSPRLAVGAELLGRALALQGKQDDARDVVLEALSTLTDATPGERESKVNLTMVLAGLDDDAGRLDDAVRNVERALELARGDAALADPSLLASLEGARAELEQKRGQPERAVEAARRTVKYLDRIGAPAEEIALYQGIIDAGGVASTTQTSN